LKANATAHAAALAGMPQDDALVQAWMTAKLADPKAAVELGELASRGSEIESELISAGMAYRIARQVDIHNMSQIEDRWVVILGAHKDFHQAKADAERIARASGVPFSMNGMIYDKKGLRFPDNYEDEVFAGGYLARRFNSTLVGEEEVEEHVSVEKSEEYQGFAPGYYIVVGSVAETSEKARTMVVEQFRKLAPKAYVKKTEVYLGCMH
jgi:hypothetical protein